MRKGRISPKKSTLRDLEEFIDPADTSLNTPVISNYNTLPTSYQNGGETDPTDPTSKSDSIALKKYYDLQLKLEGNKDVRPFPGWEEQRRQEEKTYKKRNREHIGNIFNYLGIDKNEPTEYFSKQKSMDSAKFNEDDLTLKAYGDSLINANSNFYWENYGNSPDIAHKLIEPVGSYRGDAWNFMWPDPDAQTKTLEQQGFIDPSYTQPQAQVKKESKSPIVKESKKQSLEPSVIRPTITKRVIDSTGNIISEGEKISAEEAGVKGFNAKTKTWEKKRYGGYLHNYRDGGETDPPIPTGAEIAVQDNTSASILDLWDIVQQNKKRDITTPEGALEWNRNWINSPMHKEMLTAELQASKENDSVEDYTRKRFENLEDIKITTYNQRDQFRPNLDGASRVLTGNIDLYPNRGDLIGIHEVSHSSDRRPRATDRERLIPSSSREKINEYRWNENLKGNSSDKLPPDMLNSLEVAFSPEEILNIKKERKKAADYTTIPTETRARLNAIRAGAQRLGIYDPFTEKLSDSQMDQLIKNQKSLQDKQSNDPYYELKQIYTEEEIMDMLNTISYENSSDNELPQARYGGLIPNYKEGGETDPPVQDVTYQDLKEYRKAVQATADSTQNYNAAISDYELIMKNAAATDAIDRGPTFYDPDNNAFKSGEYDRAALLAERNGVPGTFMTSGSQVEQRELDYTGTQDPVGNLALQNISGNNEGEFGFYKKPTTNPVFVDTIMQKFPPMPANKIEPRRANDLADYFRGAKLATVDTKLQPIQSNFKPKSVGYTSNTAAGYPMIQRGGGTGRVSKGAYWVPGKGYKYTND